MTSGLALLIVTESDCQPRSSALTSHRTTSTAEHCFRTPTEARDLAARLSRLAPKPPAVELGLFELFMNAIEHGNLGIGQAEKHRLLEEDLLGAEIDRRLSELPYAGRVVQVSIQHAQTELRFIIEDEGSGFDWQTIESAGETAGARSLDLQYGRGILIARRIAFSRVEYSGSGNKVTATIVL